MVTFIEGDDLFAVPGDLYVITINCVGAMGAGVAKAFSLREPGLFSRYKREIIEKKFAIGRGAVYDKGPGHRYILLPTKHNWRSPSNYTYIAKGLGWLTEQTQGHLNPEDVIVMPPLGCGHGQLSFHSVSLMIVEAAKDIPNPIIVVYPWHSPPHPSLQEI